MRSEYQSLQDSHCPEKWPHYFKYYALFCFCILVSGGALAISSARCSGAETLYEISCPSNGSCNFSVVNIYKYQGPCLGGNMTQKEIDSRSPTTWTWCDQMNCSINTCAMYIQDCGTEQTNGLSCISVTRTARIWCLARPGSLAGFILSLIAYVIILGAFCIYIVF